MKTTIQPFLSSNDVLDLSAYTSYGIYSFEDLSFSRSSTGGERGSGGGSGIVTVILPRGQQIILPSILSLSSTPSALSSSRASITARAAASSSSSGPSPNNFPLTASNFIFGIIPSSSSQDSNGNYGNIAESGSYQYFSSKDFWDGGLIWTLSWIIGLFLLTCCCVKMELDGREKKEKEIEDILAGRKRPPHDGEQQDDVEAPASPIIPPAMIQSVPRGLALPTIEEQTTYEVILDHSHHHNAEDDAEDDDDEDAYGDGVGDEEEEESFSFLSETFPSFHEDEYDQVSRRSQKNSMRSLQSFVLPSSSSSADSGPRRKADRSDSSSSSSRSSESDRSNE
jgi:hypothetical protein